MSLIALDNGWMKFSKGRIWRCQGPDWMVEIDKEGNVPSYGHIPKTVIKIKKVRSFYEANLDIAALNANNNGFDLITANVMTESLGSVPTPFNYDPLKVRLNQSTLPLGLRLDTLLNYAATAEKHLVRKEPGYIDPLYTPNRIAVGAHRVLISTALELLGLKSSPDRENQITEMILKLLSNSIYAADLAILYFVKSISQHQLQPPLMAAVYNAGSLRADQNPWNLKQYGDYIDRWVSFYNTSREIQRQHAAIGFSASHEAEV